MTAPIRAQFPVLARAGLHYLDNAAMAQMPGVVAEAVSAHDMTARANVHRGLHQLAIRADEAYDAARERVARFLSAHGDEIVFTSGCTMALNLAAGALGRSLGPGDRVVSSRAEHHSSLAPWMDLARRQGFELVLLPLRPDGRVDLSDLSAIDARCKVVAVTHASNVTGAITDLAVLGERARAVGALLVVDGAQMVPHGRVDPRTLGADLYAFAGHKAYGPTGVGVLWGKAEILERLEPVWWGGGMVARLDDAAMMPLEPPARFEAGTPPVAQAVGLARALDWIDELDPMAMHGHLQGLTARLLYGLARLPGVSLVGPGDLDNRLPLVSFVVEGCHPHDLAHLLGQRGVAVRGGAHCARPLMAALGHDQGCLRASMAPYNHQGDIDALLAALGEAMEILR
jgi:cysteine desulfurase/selenocysteine lyase